MGTYSRISKKQLKEYIELGWSQRREKIKKRAEANTEACKNWQAQESFIEQVKKEHPQLEVKKIRQKHFLG